MVGKHKGGPRGSCARTVFAGSVLNAGGQFHRGWAGGGAGRWFTGRLYAHMDPSTYLPMCTCHVQGYALQICMLTSGTLMSYLMLMPPFKWYYSMYYSYLSHCPKTSERPRWGLGHLCGFFFSLSSNRKQLLVCCSWALRTPGGFLPSPGSLTLNFFSHLPALKTSAFCWAVESSQLSSAGVCLALLDAQDLTAKLS